MELIAAAIAACAIFMPAFLALEVATPHPGPGGRRRRNLAPCRLTRGRSWT
jgi:hypothetical protein